MRIHVLSSAGRRWNESTVSSGNEDIQHGCGLKAIGLKFNVAVAVLQGHLTIIILSIKEGESRDDIIDVVSQRKDRSELFSPPIRQPSSSTELDSSSQTEWVIQVTTPYSCPISGGALKESTQTQTVSSKAAYSAGRKQGPRSKLPIRRAVAMYVVQTAFN